MELASSSSKSTGSDAPSYEGLSLEGLPSHNRRPPPPFSSAIWARPNCASLLEAHRLTKDARYLDSVKRSFVYYKRAYYDRGRIEPDFLVFFANWQSQAGRLLFEATTEPEVKDLVRAFLFELHDLVIRSGFYDRVARQPKAQACVEVACGLEGLSDAYAIAVLTEDPRAGDYRQCILTALGFLIRAQRMTGCTDRERGGFGGSLAIREQRIDLTGHVASGFIKSLRERDRRISDVTERKPGRWTIKNCRSPTLPKERQATSAWRVHGRGHRRTTRTEHFAWRTIVAALEPSR